MNKTYTEDIGVLNLQHELNGVRKLRAKSILKLVGHYSLPAAALVVAEYVAAELGVNALEVPFGMATFVPIMKGLEKKRHSLYGSLIERTAEIKSFKEKILAAKRTDSVREYLGIVGVEPQYQEEVLQIMKSELICDSEESFGKYISLEERFDSQLYPADI